MAQFEYKAIAAPRRAKRVKGAKSTTDRFAHAMTDALNTMGAEGWEYVRSETLPVDEKKGMLSSAVEAYHSVMVFRRPIEEPRLATRPAESLRAVETLPEEPALQTAPPAPGLTVGPADRTE